MMTEKQIKEKHALVCEWVTQQQIKRALRLLGELVAATELSDVIITLENLESTYENMLKYTLEGVDDPERMKVYDHLRTSILELNEEVKAILLSRFSRNHVILRQEEMRSRHRMQVKQQISSLNDLSFYDEMKESLQGQYGITSPAPGREESHRLMIKEIFNYLWLTDRYREPEMELINYSLDHQGFTWYERALFVSAITLSLFRYFDVSKFIALHKYYLDQEDEVAERSFIGLILAFYLYDQRLFLYPELLQIIEGLKEQKRFFSELESVTLQIIRARETENISRKLKEEIIPEIQRMGPDLQEKLNLDKLLPEDFTDDKNPDWQKVFKGSERLYEKMEEFSRMQMEGSDVFMSAFAHLKNFSFFDDIENWFTPFLPESPVIEESMQDTDPDFNRKMFLEGLSNTAFLCNSDKYSFCLNLKIMPHAQKEMILKLFSAELEGMKEMEADEELVRPESKTKAIYAQYLQDMYRFFKLYRYRDAFDDIFNTPLDVYNRQFFNRFGDIIPILENIGNYFFEHNQFEDSLDIFLRLNKISEKPSYEILEKIGYAYQKLKQYEDALSFYLRAELFDTNKKWLNKKIAFCYRKLAQPDKALEYYRQAEQADPENSIIRTAIGHCYLDKGEFETALKYYFKVEYGKPDDVRILRPIAWCYFALNKQGKAEKYYTKILESDATGHDYLNAGHVAWCRGDKRQAIHFYREAIRYGFEDFAHFLRTFRADQSYLLTNGIDPTDIPLMLDYLEYTLQKNR
ncbi:MAG: tetratricopeptide repeat protein [Chlorobi bacterium]|nr:tetratricopeptide repeat protein [Chlorobiota bacterium]